MTPGVILDYALARVHARHGARPTAADWQRLELAPGRQECLLAARHTGLRAWLDTVADEDDLDTGEARLRERARRYVLEVAGWLPADWQPAARWLAWLPDLEILAYLEQGGTALPWIVRDPRYAAWGEGAAGALAHAGSAAAREALTADPALTVAGNWKRHWLDLWPRDGSPPAARLADLLVRAGEPPWPASGMGLVRLFRDRKHACGAVFAHLGLVLGDLRRLAGLLAFRMPHTLSAVEHA
jgi:hypothetical protein